MPAHGHPRKSNDALAALRRERAFTLFSFKSQRHSRIYLPSGFDHHGLRSPDWRGLTGFGGFVPSDSRYLFFRAVSAFGFAVYCFCFSHPVSCVFLRGGAPPFSVRIWAGRRARYRRGRRAVWGQRRSLRRNPGLFRA